MPSIGTVPSAPQIPRKPAPNMLQPNLAVHTKSTCVHCSRYISIIQELSTPLNAPSESVKQTEGTHPTRTVSHPPVVLLPLEKNVLDAFQVLTCTLSPPTPPPTPAQEAGEVLCVPCQEKTRRKWYTPMERFMREF